MNLQIDMVEARTRKHHNYWQVLFPAVWLACFVSLRDKSFSSVVCLSFLICQLGIILHKGSGSIIRLMCVMCFHMLGRRVGALMCRREKEKK